jgi:two-component system, NtrC family, nitrogen regulation response regulator NtrX
MNATRWNVLIVDDDPGVRRQMAGVLADEGFDVTEAADAAQALVIASQGRFDVIGLDVNMPGMSGLTALTRLREDDPTLAVVIVTGEEQIKRARDFVVRGGAFDLIEKPPDPTHLVEVLREAAKLTRTRRRGAEVAPAPAVDEDELGIVGRSPAIVALIEQIRRIAPSNGRVLVTGENGAGKELVAAAIHRLSKRAAQAFVRINCAAIPKDLVESELFGYERGAFTGAMQAKKGRLELADQGTLFLDEVGDLSLESQAKLLRALETGEVERVGGTRTQRVDVRLVSATNKDLPAAIEAGDFREDLYYRLNVLPLAVPALRQRRGDIGLLAQHFLAQFAAAEHRAPPALEPEAVALLEDYAWPGNVRELRNVMERAAILVAGDTLRAGDLSPWLDRGNGRDEAVGLRGEIERREADAVRKALEAANWNVTQAAAALGIDRTNLHRKMRKYDVHRR